MLARLVILLALLLAADSVRAQVGNFGSAGSPQAALTNTAVTIKAKPGSLDSVVCYNPNASIEYIQVYDTTSAVVVGTTPNKFFVPVGSGSTQSLLNANMITGIKAAATSTPNGAGAPASPLVCTFLFK
jgi:hypothetical protein